MIFSNISGKASILLSGLLVAVLLIWQLQLIEKPKIEKRVKHSQLFPLPQELKQSLAIATITFPSPPESVKKQPVKAKKREPVEREKITPVKTRKPALKQTTARDVKHSAPKKVVSPTVRVSILDTSPITKEGRTLLRLMEHGSGPSIGLAWPEGDVARSSLYKILRGCYGMKTALMDVDGTLYSSTESRKWRPDMDHYSGFVRQPSGLLPSDENKEAEAVRRRHRLSPDSTIVRLYPRRVDAVLLGGLQNLLGQRYRKAKIIHGNYRQYGQDIFIDNITADGALVRGRIAFYAAQGGCG